MAVRAPELAVVVSTTPERGDFARAFALARAARQLDIEVGLFFMHDAVHGLPAAQAELSQLSQLGCELTACASSASERGLGEAELGMLLGSQDDHAALVHRADRLVAFT